MSLMVELETRTLLESCAAKLRALPRLLDRAAHRATADATDYAADVIRDMTPVGEGEGRGGERSHADRPHLYEQWATRVGGFGPEFVGEIYNRAPYAAAVEEGAKARRITAKRVFYLWWPSVENGRLRFVNWPGFTGRRMGEKGLNAARAGIFRRYTEAIERTVRTVFP